MKKLGFLALLFGSVLTLGACSNQNNATSSSREKELQATIDSLEKKISSLEGESSSTPQEETSESSASENSPEDKTFGLGEEAILYNEGKELYSLKIVKATTALSQTNEAYTNGKPQNTIEVTYEYKNYSYPEPMQISTQFLAAYDANGLAGESSNMMSGQTDVSQGRASQSTTWFTMNEDMTAQNEVEIEYVNDFSLGFKDSLKFKVPLEH